MNTHADVSNDSGEDKAGGSANKNVEGSWAEPVHHLETSDLPKEAINLNVSGRHLSVLSMDLGSSGRKLIGVRWVRFKPARRRSSGYGKRTSRVSGRKETIFTVSSRPSHPVMSWC